MAAQSKVSGDGFHDRRRDGMAIVGQSNFVTTQPTRQKRSLAWTGFDRRTAQPDHCGMRRPDPEPVSVSYRDGRLQFVHLFLTR